jgi:N-methylhydantoinase A
VQGVSYRVQLVVPVEKFDYAPVETKGDPKAIKPTGTRELRHLGDAPIKANVYQREALPVGAQVRGAAIINEPLCTILVCPGQIATVGTFGEISIEAEKGKA